MRNLKRALSLGLTAAMISGLMVMGSSAAGYADVTSEDNQEAIEVLQAIGVMVGDENGDFNPDALVTRNEMAVVMSNLMEYNVATYSGTSPFTDVPSWAEPYVAACWTNGITAGYTDTTYGGSDNVTTAQAALMLMKALGYFQYSSDFGSDWQLSTITQGNRIDLFADVDSGVREAMTRNDLAQLVLNTLESGTVEASTDGSISVGDVTIVSGVEYNYVTSGQSYARAIKDEVPQNTATSTSSGQYIVELGERLYQGDLRLYDETTDNFGAPANRWTYRNSEIGTYAETADYVFEGGVESQEMNDAVGSTVVDDYSWEVLVDGDDNWTDADGDPAFDQEDVDADNSDTLNGTGRGTTTYVYLDDDAHGSYDGTATVVIINTYVAEITRVNNGTITLDDMDGSDLEFDVEGYDEEDVVLYTKSTSNGTSWTVEEILGLAERVEGEATTIRNQDRVTVDGTTYRYSTKFNDANGEKIGVDSVDENVAFYLDTQGNIIMIDEADESNDYAYVYSVGNQNDLYGEDAVYGARLILTDGTSMRITLDDDTVDGVPSGSTVANYFAGRLVSYSEEDDGTYSLNIVGVEGTNYTTASDDIVRNGTSRIKLPGTNEYIYTDSNTAFLINDSDDDPDDFNAYVGYDSVPDMNAIVGDDTTRILYYVNSRGVARAVVVLDADVTGTANDVIFVVGNESAKMNGTGSNRYYVYDAVVNGEVTQLEVSATSGTAYATVSALETDEIGVYFGLSENSSGYVTRLTTTEPTDVDVDRYVGTQRQSSGGVLGFSYDAEDETYDVRLAANSDATIVYYDGDDLTVGGSVRTDTNDLAYVVTDDGEVIAICVVEVASGASSEIEDTEFNETATISGLTVRVSTDVAGNVVGLATEALEDAGYTVTGVRTATGGEYTLTASRGSISGYEFTTVTTMYYSVSFNTSDSNTIASPAGNVYVAAGDKVTVVVRGGESSNWTGWTVSATGSWTVSNPTVGEDVTVVTVTLTAPENVTSGTVTLTAVQQ